MPKPATPQFLPKSQPLRLPSTRQIDARIKRQTRAFDRWRIQYLRLKDEGGRTQRGPRPTKPPPFVLTYTTEGDAVVFQRAPYRRHPDGTTWEVPAVSIHPTFGPLYYLDSLMVMQQQLLRTIPRRNLLVVRGPTPAESLTFKAIQQEWVRFPSDGYASIRGKDPKKSVCGFHRWLCYVVRRTTISS